MKPQPTARAPTPENGEALYSVRIEEKTFRQAAGGEIEVIRDLAFTLAPQTFTCMLGPSGCGKTTTLRIVLGLDEEFSGAISPNLRLARPAAVFQEPRLLPWRSVEQNIRLALPAELSGKDLSPVLDAVGLDGFRKSFPGELSLGMARRAALAPRLLGRARESCFSTSRSRRSTSQRPIGCATS